MNGDTTVKLHNFLFKFAVVVCLLFAFQGSALAALADSANHKAYKKESELEIMYWGDLNYTVNDSTSSLFSQALDMTYMDVTRPILLTVYGTSGAAAQDVNILIEGSDWKIDSTFENSHTNATFDDVDLFSADGVVKGYINFMHAASDTLALGISGTRLLKPSPSDIDPAFFNRFIRVEADGQAGNRSDVKLRWQIRGFKKAGAPRSGAAAVYDVAGGS